jgi:hypothetical protein
MNRIAVDASLEIYLGGHITLKDLQEFVNTADEYDLPENTYVIIKDGAIKILVVDDDPMPRECEDEGCALRHTVLRTHTHE